MRRHLGSRGPDDQHEQGGVAAGRGDGEQRHRCRRPRPSGDLAHVVGHRAPEPAAPAYGEDGQQGSDRERGDDHRDHPAGRSHGRGHRHEHGQGDGDLHELAQRSLPPDRAQAQAEPAGSGPVADRAVHVPGYAAGKGRVEQLRPVVRRHGDARGDDETEAAGHQAPAPRAAQRADRGGEQGGSDKCRRDEVQAGSERPGPQMGRPGQPAGRPRAGDAAGATTGRPDRRTAHARGRYPARWEPPTGGP